MSKKTSSVSKDARTSSRKSPQKKSTTGTKKRSSASVSAATPVGAQVPGSEPHTNGQQLTEEQLKKVKTGLTKRDFEKYRKLLLEKRAELVGDVESLQVDARNEDASFSYEHMADVGTDSYEQEFTLGLVESERKLLAEIDDALDRINNGTFGVCIESGEPISKARLEAKPWAKYTIDVAREREKRGL